MIRRNGKTERFIENICNCLDYKIISNSNGYIVVISDGYNHTKELEYRLSILYTPHIIKTHVKFIQCKDISQKLKGIDMYDLLINGESLYFTGKIWNL